MGDQDKKRYTENISKHLFLKMYCCRRAGICVETSSGIVELGLFKLLAPGIGCGYNCWMNFYIGIYKSHFFKL